MKFAINHVNINVSNLEESLKFYKNALMLHEARRKKHPAGEYEIVFLTDDAGTFFLELTWLSGKQGRYDLGDNETHIAFIPDDFEAAYALHERMGCICFENKGMGVYFIEDPDGYWMELSPAR